MVANKQRGEVPIVIGDKTYIMRLTTNAACQMEAVTGKSFDQVIAGSLSGSITDLRAFLWASLLSRHQDITIEQVGDLIDEVGPKELKRQLDEVVKVNTSEMPKAEGNGNPPHAQGGTGGNSTSTHGASA